MVLKMPCLATLFGSNRMLKNPGVAEGESATFGFLSFANASIAIFIVKMCHLLYPKMIGLDELIFYSHNINGEPSETEHAESTLV